jgi:hypothetical protein
VPSRTPGLLSRLAEAAEDRTGYTLVPKERNDLLEAAWDELRATNRELDLLGWNVLDYLSGQPQELTTPARRKMVQRSRHVWMNDPQAGASVSLMNDFCFGRGVPQPRAKDKAVQDILDEFWNDPDNKRALTSFSKQQMLGTDLALQSNLFFLVFDDGDDGKVKMMLLNHDWVENCVRDPENNDRVLYWLVRPRSYRWDFKNDRPDTSPTSMTQPPIYYEDWAGLQEAKDEQDADTREEPVPTAPANRVGKGKVYHVAINRFSGQVFGVPEMQRTIRWFSAYNDFMKARVDIAQASAAFIMKRKVKGTPTQLARMASKAISRSGDIAGGMDERAGMQAPPRAGSIINENDAVSHENFKLDSGAGNAGQDAHMIRAPISAATRFPQSYYGDETNTSLATATSLELPVLKAVESRQEVFEAMIRDMIDRVIERAVDAGLITDELTDEEIQDYVMERVQADLAAARVEHEKLGRKVLLAEHKVVGSKREGYTLRMSIAYEENGKLVEAHEDKAVDESDTKRDLSYDFSMPSPLRRMMGDLVTAVQTTAATFDPNNTNLELTKALATIVFGEAFEIQDPSDLVEKIWPPGYQDPMLAAAEEQQQTDGPQVTPGQPGPNAFGSPFGADGTASAPSRSRLPEELRSGPYNAMEAWRLMETAIADDDGELAYQLADYIREGSIESTNDLVRSRTRNQQEQISQLFDEDVTSVAMAALKTATPEVAA